MAENYNAYRPVDRSEEPNRTLKSALAAFTALILFASLFALPAESYLFTARPYQQALQAEGVYGRLPDRLASLAAAEGGLNLPWGNGLNVFRYFDRERYRELFSSYLPPEWVQPQVDGMLNRVWSFLNLETNRIQLPLDLTAPKSRLAGAEGAQTVSLIVSSWPACSFEDAARAGEGMANGNLADLPLCRPPDEVRPALESEVGQALQGYSTTVPDQVDLAALPGSTFGSADPTQTSAYTFYRAARALDRALPLLALGLLVALAALTARTARDAFFWLAQPMLIAGIAALVSTLILAVSMNLISGQLIYQAAASISPSGASSAQSSGILSDLTRVLSAVGSRYLLFVSLLALVTAAAGVGFLFLRRFPGRTSEEKQ